MFRRFFAFLIHMPFVYERPVPSTFFLRLKMQKLKRKKQKLSLGVKADFLFILISGISSQKTLVNTCLNLQLSRTVIRCHDIIMPGFTILFFFPGACYDFT